MTKGPKLFPFMVGLAMLVMASFAIYAEYTSEQNKRLKVGDCFEVPTIKATLFKVRSVLKHSYLAGKRAGRSTGVKFNAKYPAMQITSISFDEEIYRTDCMLTKEWKEKWHEAILNEYDDRKSDYDKDAIIPKRK